MTLLEDIAPLLAPYGMETLTMSTDTPAPATHRKVSTHTGYFDRAFTEREDIISQSVEALAEVEFDTIVATGVSGLVVAPILAHALGKDLFVVRKSDDTTNHSGKPTAGVLGERWVFVDDFISSGATFRRVHKAVLTAASTPGYGKWVGSRYIDEPPIQTKLRGIFEYNTAYNGVRSMRECGIYGL